MKTNTNALGLELLRKIDGWWRAANYLSVGQIYLRDNPLLREPLKPEHVKHLLLGHWGTTPGQNFIYAHSFPFPGEFRAMSRQNVLAPFTKEANWAIRSAMHLAQFLTTYI